jgi:hypothetical protein
MTKADSSHVRRRRAAKRGAHPIRWRAGRAIAAAAAGRGRILEFDNRPFRIVEIAATANLLLNCSGRAGQSPEPLKRLHGKLHSKLLGRPPSRAKA